VRELQVPKRRVEVELTFTDGECGRFAVFVAESCSERAGPERVSDVLARGGRFFPAVDPATGEGTLVASAAVAVARVPRAAEPGDAAEELAGATEHAIEVHLHDGRLVRGVASYALPPERSRLLDFLNVAPPFLRLRSADGDVLLVNRDQVVRVTLFR
jgi:hypothetical protein